MNIPKLPFCSIVIPALNEEQFIRQCLESLTRQTYPRDHYEIIVVDNGSTDKTVEIASQYANRVVSKPEGNVGSIRNHGISMANGRIIICTDADCVVDPTWIEAGVDLIQRKPGCAFGGGLKPRTNSTWVERYWLLNDEGGSVQQNSLMGSCIFIQKDDFLGIGGFEEGVTSGEDSDLSSRLTQAGLQVEMSPKLTVAHLGNPTRVTDFVRRQIWHSENYIKKIAVSIKDKVFWLTLAYSSSVVLLFILFAMATNGYYTMPAVAIVQSMPAALSIKRVVRAKFKIKRLQDPVLILILDNLYLIGRSLGLAKGLFALAKANSTTSKAHVK